MKIENSMIKDVFTVHYRTSLSDLMSGFMASDQISAPVVDDNGCLVGMVSIHDIYDQVLPTYVDMDERLVELMPESYIEDHLVKIGHMTVDQIMIRELDTVKADESVTRAVGIFVQHRRRVLPVVDDHNRIVGLITQKSVLERFNWKISQKKD